MVLGAEFIDSVRETLLRIGENPTGYWNAIKDVGSKSEKVSLWSMVPCTGRRVGVIACLHGKRNRVLAKKRALGILQMPDPT
jgi:hypothetical protein